MDFGSKEVEPRLMRGGGGGLSMDSPRTVFKEIEIACLVILLYLMQTDLILVYYSLVPYFSQNVRLYCSFT